MKALTKTLVILLVLALLPAVVSAGTAPAVVSVDSVTVTVGQEFTVPVRITGVSNLYGADVRLVYDPAVQQVPHDVFEVMMPRGTCGVTKVWFQAWNASDNATIDFLVGLHEYEG